MKIALLIASNYISTNLYQMVGFAVEMNLSSNFSFVTSTALTHHYYLRSCYA